MLTNEIIKSPAFNNVLEKSLCERSFYYFVKKAWQWIDAAAFIETWHVECVCTHMQAL